MLPWSERRFSFLRLSQASVACGHVDESEVESMASCCRAGFYGETQHGDSALARLHFGASSILLLFLLTSQQKQVAQSSSLNGKYRVVKAHARID